MRSTGAGMGCPDWPKCFGSWVPPTQASEVPLSYYSNPLSSKDGQLIFNPIKTWTEYVNRLLGVVIGFSIFVQLVLAWTSRAVPISRWMSMAAFVMVCFQGWLGAKVVSTDLRPLVITIHLVVALLIALALVAAVHFSKASRNPVFTSLPLSRFSNSWLYVGFAILLLQFFLGTEVRSQVDVFFKTYNYEQRWLYSGMFDWMFYVHRSLSVLVLLVLGIQVFRYGRYFPVDQFRVVILPFLLAVFMGISGAILIWFDFPALAQPFHLFFGFLIVCAQFHLFLSASSLKILAHGNSGSG